MSDTTPSTQQCNSQRAAGATVETGSNWHFDNWPGNIEFTAPLYLRPKTRAELATAILKAESAGHHVRAFGSTWSFSDAVRATTGNQPGAMIDTSQLNKGLQSELPYILAAGVDSTALFHVEAGITCTDLNLLLDKGWGEWLRVPSGPVSSDPAAVSWEPNRIDVFACGTDNQIGAFAWNGSQSTGWSPLGGQFSSGPAVASWSPNRLDVFGRGMDNALWTNAWTGSAWTGWSQVDPNPISSDPAAVSWGPNRIDVFACGTDNQMYSISWDGSNWTGWSPLGGQFTSGPAVASWGPNRLDVFGRGTDNALWTNAWTGAAWTGWSQVAPNPISSDPAAVSWGPDRIDVFARGTDNQMYSISWDGSNWTGWSPLGGQFTSGPAVASWGPNRLDVFGRGTDNWLYTKSRTGSYALEAGGGSGQTLAGMMSTSTHSGDSLVPPFVDYVRAIHLVGAGGIEHWIEPDFGITDPAKLQLLYPCLAVGNIHYNTRLFNAVLVSAGSMGVIYSVVIKTVSQYGLHQHRVATTWEDLLMADPDLTKVIDGTYLESRNTIPAEIDILDSPIRMTRTPGRNSFSQIVINPYPFYGNDASLTVQEGLRVGHHLCFVTNRVQIQVPTNPYNPKPDDSIESMGTQMATAARNALGGGLDGPGNDLRFVLFGESMKVPPYSTIYNGELKPDVSKQAAALVDFLADNYQPGTMSALIHFVLKKILPVEDRFAVNLSEVIVWNDKIKSFCVEAAFTVPGALAFVPKVLALVASYAARSPQVYIGGYLALRFVGKKTAALLGMQQWSPTCCVEYLGLAGSRAIDEFANDLQKLALASGGILHLGLQNNVMTATDMQNAYGAANIEAFRRARGLLSQHGTLATFDNSFTERLGLSALKGLVFSGNSSDVIMHEWDPGAFVGQPGGHLVENHPRRTEVIWLYNHSDRAIQVNDVRITSPKDVLPGSPVFKVISRPLHVDTLQFGMIEVEYAGTGPGLLTGTVEVDCDDPIEPTLRMALSTSVIAIGKHAQLQLAPTSLDFGTKVISTTNSKIIEITNVGSYDASIAPLTLEQSTEQFQVPLYANTTPTSGGLPVPLLPGQSNSFPVWYSPTTRGAAHAKLVINMQSRTDAGVDYLQRVEVPIAATAIMPTIFLARGPQRWVHGLPGEPDMPIRDIELKVLDFGVMEPTQTSAASFWIRNVGDAPLTVQGVVVYNQGNFGVTDPTSFPALLQPGSEMEVLCGFLAPPVPGMTAAGTFRVLSDDPIRTDSSDPLLLGAVLEVKGRSGGPNLTEPIEFEQGVVVVSPPASATLTLRSDGTDPVTVRGVKLIELNRGTNFSVSSVPQIATTLVLAPGTELTLTVALTAIRRGVYEADLIVAHNGNPHRTSQVRLRGNVQ